MKKLLIALFLFFMMAISIRAMALECPQESLQVIYKTDERHYAYSFICTEGEVSTRVIILSGDPTEGERSLIENMFQFDCIESPHFIHCQK